MITSTSEVISTSMESRRIRIEVRNELDPMKSQSRSRTSSISSIDSLATVEDEPPHPFPFFSLPFELRTQVLENVLCVERTIDIDFNVSGITSIFLVSKRFHEESAAVFFSKNKFRLFPTHSRAVSKRAQPLIRKFPASYRRLITRLELRLGPYWTNPPACWKVDIKLGLKDLVKLRRLDVFVECDPSHSMYAGFRKSESYYTQFSAKMFESILRRTPALKEVRLDGYSGVSATDPLVQTLVDLAQSRNKAIHWGSGLSFKHFNEKIDLDLGLISSALDTLTLQLLAPHA